MPELDFKGKEFVRNHHLTVPYRPLVPVPEKGIGEPDLTGNLIIHGDNLEALKALLPMYAGKVDCIFIDPPYNTGNEGWSYNDNVNSPVIKAWFTENPVGVEDALRHDKWCCMMWPRLKLLRELLAETGSIWITLDDNEVHRARMMLDEVFGEDNFIANVVWEKTSSARNDAQNFSSDHDHLLVYGKSAESMVLNRMPRTSNSEEAYSNPDDDPRGPWRQGDYKCNKNSEERPSLYYPITHPVTGDEVWPRVDRVWAYSKEQTEKNIHENRLWWGKTGNYRMPMLKRFRAETRDTSVPRTIWKANEVEQTRTARTQLRNIFPEDPFATPKPTQLIKRIVELATSEGDTILDSFAGSGTTAHSALQAGGDRKFILVEMEDYADTLTAERVRRVINGYPYQGSQRETLYEKKLTWTEIRKGDALAQEALDAKALHEADYDSIETKVDNGVLKVIGVRNVEEQAPGLGGAFTYCELGRPIELDKLLSGGALPERADVADYIIYLAGLDKNKLEHRAMPDDVKDHYLGTADGMHIWLLYRPDRKYLSSADSALTLENARAIHASDKQGRHRVYSPAKYVGTKILRQENIEIEHVPLPLALFRGHTD